MGIYKRHDADRESDVHGLYEADTAFAPLLQAHGRQDRQESADQHQGPGGRSLIEIGDDSVIGGDAVLIGHLAEHGKLKLKRTIIGKKVTIGLGAVIMPGASIGDRALIAARSVLPKNTQVPENTLFAGMPAKFVKSFESKGKESS